MLTYTEKDLLAMGIQINSSGQLIIHEQNFRLIFSFTTKMKSFAENFCHREEGKGHNCLVIEADSTISVWRQTAADSNLQQEVSGDLELLPNCTGKLIRQKFSAGANYLQPSLITQCTTILTEYMGPIALFIVNDLSASNPNCPPAEFIEALASRIPDLATAREFRRKILKSL
jgi:hypothetical protein